jgi:hypothetical protein
VLHVLEFTDDLPTRWGATTRPPLRSGLRDPTVQAIPVFRESPMVTERHIVEWHGEAYTIESRKSLSRVIALSPVWVVFRRGEFIGTLPYRSEKTPTELTCRMVEQAGYRCEYMDRGKRALALLETEAIQVDLAIIDVYVPDIMGSCVTANLRRTCLKPEYAYLPLSEEPPTSGQQGWRHEWPLDFVNRLIPITGYESEFCRMSTWSSGGGAPAPANLERTSLTARRDVSLRHDPA